MDILELKNYEKEIEELLMQASLIDEIIKKCNMSRSEDIITREYIKRIMEHNSRMNCELKQLKEYLEEVIKYSDQMLDALYGPPPVNKIEL